MDWKVFWATFGTLFLAEMGDKTQLAALTMAAETRLPLSVFLGGQRRSGPGYPFVGGIPGRLYLPLAPRGPATEGRRSKFHPDRRIDALGKMVTAKPDRASALAPPRP
jgi:hypothetical protein